MADLTTATPLFGIPTGAPINVPAQTSVATPKKHSGIDNVLGFLGDFITSRLHMGTPYRDARRNEKLNSAIQQDLADPSGAFANTGNQDIAMANKLRDQTIDNKRLQTVADQTSEARASRLAQQKEAVRQAALSRAASYFNNVHDEKGYANGRSLWKNSVQVQSDPDLAAELDNLYPETFDAKNVATNISQYVPLSTQWSQRLQKERMTIQDENADQSNDTRNRAITVRDARQAAGQAISERRAAAKANAPRATKSQGSYVGDDGKKHVMLSDGTERVSKGNVRPTSRGVVEGETRTLPDGRTARVVGGKVVIVK